MVNFYNFSPSDILESEWLVFAGVFLVVFAMVYISLSNFFTKGKKKQYPWESDSKVLENKSSVAIISLIIAFFTAAAFVRQNLIEGIFGEALSVWIFVLVLIVLVILSIPFYKALKQNVGGGIAIFIIVAGLWAILKFGFDPSHYNLPSGFYDVYEIVVHPVFLIVLVGVGIVKSLIKKSGKRR